MEELLGQLHSYSEGKSIEAIKSLAKTKYEQFQEIIIKDACNAKNFLEKYLQEGLKRALIPCIITSATCFYMILKFSNE